MQAKVALTTCADEADAERLAAALVERKVAACVTVIPGARSVYRWKGSVERSSESLLVIKTSAEAIAKLEQALLELHKYETPEFVVLDAPHVNERYAAWLLDCVE